jgi:hypothetical protein
MNAISCTYGLQAFARKKIKDIGGGIFLEKWVAETIRLGVTSTTLWSGVYEYAWQSGEFLKMLGLGKRSICSVLWASKNQFLLNSLNILE